MACESSPARRVLPAAWPGAIALLVAITLAYWNSGAAPFVFDDIPAVRDNATLAKPGIFFSPPPQTTVAGRPILNASFAVSAALAGGAPAGHHAVNILIHAGAALVLFGLMRRTLLLEKFRGRFGPRATSLALVVALLWGLHPVQTEAVTYIVQRAESLMGFFFLLTLYCFVRGIDSTRRSAWFGAALVACAFGMGTKEVMAAAPLLVFCYDRTFVAGNFRDAWRQRGRWHLGFAATWTLLAALILQAGGNRGGSIGFGVGIGWWQHALTQFPAIAHYVSLTFWPHPLVFEYEPEWVSSLGDVAPALLLVVGLLAATLVGLRRNHPGGFVGLWAFAILAPTSLLPAPTQLIVEHRMYLALAPVLAWLGALAWAGAGRRGLALLGAAAVAFGCVTVARNHDYRSELSLWADTVAKRPGNAFAHGSLGNALSRAGRLDEAFAECTAAVRLDPKRALLRYNLGVVLAKLGREQAAIVEYAAAVKLEPEYADAHNNYAVMLARTHHRDEALKEFETTLRLRPSDAEAHFNRGTLLLELDRAPAAIEEFEIALRLEPNYPAAAIAAGTAFAAMGRLDDALAHYEKAVALAPDNIVARNKAGLVLLAVGRVPAAIDCFEEAVRLKAGDPESLANLAMARKRQEKTAPH